jgi:hypothetical protein
VLASLLRLLSSSAGGRLRLRPACVRRGRRHLHLQLLLHPQVRRTCLSCGLVRLTRDVTGWEHKVVVMQQCEHYFQGPEGTAGLLSGGYI